MVFAHVTVITHNQWLWVYVRFSCLVAVGISLPTPPHPVVNEGIIGHPLAVIATLVSLFQDVVW